MNEKQSLYKDDIGDIYLHTGYILSWHEKEKAELPVVGKLMC